MIPTPCIQPSRREANVWRSFKGVSAGAVFISWLLMWTSIPASGQALKDQVEYSARDSIRYDMLEQTVYLFGAATVKYGDVQLTAERISFSFKNEEARAFGAPDSSGKVIGKPNFVQEGHTIEADSIRYNFKTKQGLIREVRTQEQETWVHASLSKRLSNAEVHSKGGMLTTCDRPYPHYHFQVSKMIVIPDDKIVTGPAYMRFRPFQFARKPSVRKIRLYGTEGLNDVTAFFRSKANLHKLDHKFPTPIAVPFGFFPNKKGGSSGILIPTYGVSDQLGYFLLNGGYYIPISDHFDQQITGDIYSRGSWGLRSVTRYRTRYRYSGNLDLSRSTLLRSDPEFPDFERETNFFIRWNHLVDPKASLTDRFTASVNLGSSNNFRNNLNSNLNDYLTNTFQSNISWTHLWPGRPYNFTLNARHTQTDTIYNFTLPAMTLNLQRIFPIQMIRGTAAPSRWYDQIGVSYSANFENRLSTEEEQLFLQNLPTLGRQMQNGLRHIGTVNTSFKTRYFALNPEFRFTERWYMKTLRGTMDPDSGFVVLDTVQGFERVGEWSVGANLTSKLYGMYSLGGDRVKAIRHVITPTAGFNFHPDFGTQIEAPFDTLGTLGTYSPYDIGIFGKPQQGESGTLNLGLIQSVEAKVGDRKSTEESGVKKMSLIDFVGINTSYDLLKDSLRWSPVNVSARTMLFNRINLNYVSLWDPYAVNYNGQRIDQSELSSTGKFARMVYTNVAIGFDVKSTKYGQPVQDSDQVGYNETVVEDSDPSRGAKINFSLPWRLGVNYSYDINRSYAGDSIVDSQRQSILFNGDVNILKYWKLGFSSGYDLVAEEWTPTSLNLYWDLHCWEFNLNVIPIGLRKSFTFRINVKASILRDMKYEQRRPLGNDGELLY